MGNKFGNYTSKDQAAIALTEDGFKLNDRGLYTKSSMTGGSLMEQPRRCTAIVEISSYRVDGKWSADGKDYQVYQHHFI